MELIRPLAAFLIAAGSLACVRNPEMRVDTTCSSKQAYGSVNMGLHGMISVKAENLGNAAWLSISERGSDPVLIDYGNNKIIRTIDGFARSINGGDTLTLDNAQYIVRIERGPEADRRTILEQTVAINCPAK